MGCPRCGGLDPAFRGFSTTLKPAFEPIVVARKPLAGTVAANVLAWGTGALNIDGCRVGLGDERPPTGSGVSLRATSTASPYRGGDGPNVTPTAGRWPANVVLDGPMAAALDEQSGVSVSRASVVSDGRVQVESSSYGVGQGRHDPSNSYADSGGASRFFYTTKATSAERPRYTRPKLRLRGGLTPEQVDHVRARLAEAGVQVD